MPLPRALIAPLAHLSATIARSPLPLALRRAIYTRFSGPMFCWRPVALTRTTRHGVAMRLMLDQIVESRIFMFGEWEPNIAHYVASRLRPGDIFVDIGANVGYYSLLAGAIVGPRGRVHAIEASPSIAADLRHNVALQAGSPVRVIEAAVSDRAGEVVFHLSALRNRGSSSIVRPSEGSTVEARVRAAPLADLVPEADVLAARFLKIDVEGAEALVIAGMAGLIARLSPTTEVLLEITPSALALAGATPADVVGPFLAAGFGAWQFVNDYNPRAYLVRRYVDPVPFDGDYGRAADLVLRRPAADAALAAARPGG